MDERTRAATYEDVKRVAELLEHEGVEYALIGGYALALQGIVRLTEDVDILVEPTTTVPLPFAMSIALPLTVEPPTGAGALIEKPGRATCAAVCAAVALHPPPVTAAYTMPWPLTRSS